VTQPRRATLDEVPTLAKTLARALSDDPAATFPFPPGEADDRLESEFVAYDAPATEFGWLWTTEPDIAGALWVPPGADSEYATISDSAGDALGTMNQLDHARFDAFWAWIETHRPPGPHWYLDHIGVAAEHRGEGHGRRLIEVGAEAADIDGTPCFLITSTPTNVRLYERFGFAVTYMGAAPIGSPIIWAMVRPPKR
jgi:ribosomal protein S18 acetylase RimI-like enzyme